MEDPVHIFIFKTNLDSPSDIKLVGPVLQNMDGISQWTVDREDSDKILRVVTNRHEPNLIIHQLRELGYHCQELED